MELITIKSFFDTILLAQFKNYLFKMARKICVKKLKF